MPLLNVQTNPVNTTKTDDGVTQYSFNSNQASPAPLPTSNKDISEALPEKVQSLTGIINQTNISGSTLKPFDEVLMLAIKMNASDIHLTSGYKVTFRVDGELKFIDTNVLTDADMEVYVKKLIANRKDLQLDQIKDVDMGYSVEGKRFRVNIFKQMGKFSLVLRIIPTVIPNLSNLGLPPIIHEMVNMKSGLILVTGPTGSGKSTTIASILNSINTTKAKHIVTIEDPIEFIFPKALSFVDQREYGTDFESWTKALKALLRQDPDVVLVGEMRDLDTISSTITVSETGHLVFATLHTNSAAQSIDRIIDVFPEVQQSQVRSQLANVINAVISQRLVPLRNGGRKCVLEIMIANPAVKNAIREGKTHLIDNVIQTSSGAGMMSLEASLANLIRTGEVDVNVAKSFSNKPQEIDTLLANR